MTEPREGVVAIQDGATYKLPTYVVTADGLQDAGGVELKLVKGNKEDEAVFRQEGTMTEALLETALQYLKSVNKPPLSDRHTSIAITHIEDALLHLAERARERKKAGVLGTYKPTTNA